MLDRIATITIEITYAMAFFCCMSFVALWLMGVRAVADGSNCMKRCIYVSPEQWKTEIPNG